MAASILVSATEMDAGIDAESASIIQNGYSPRRKTQSASMRLFADALIGAWSRTIPVSPAVLPFHCGALKMERHVTKSRSQLALEALDEVAHQMERKWGVGRLTRLVPIDLAERFERQLAKLNAAITEEATGGSVASVEHEAGRMVNAWRALNAAAEAAGADPVSGQYLTARMSDGRSLVICGDLEGMSHWLHQNRGSAAAVWTMEEVVRVLEGFDLVNRTKHLFEGAVVGEVRVDPERVRPKVDWAEGDRLPDYMMAG